MNEPSSTNALKDTAVSRLHRFETSVAGRALRGGLDGWGPCPCPRHPRQHRLSRDMGGRGGPSRQASRSLPRASRRPSRLVQVQSQLSALAATADAPGQAALDDAVTQLAKASFPDNAGGTRRSQFSLG